MGKAEGENQKHESRKRNYPANDRRSPPYFLDSLFASQIFNLASWELSDVKVFLALIYAGMCFLLHDAPPPESTALQGCWRLFNSNYTLLALSASSLLLFGTQIAVLMRSKQLTVSLQLFSKDSDCK